MVDREADTYSLKFNVLARCLCQNALELQELQHRGRLGRKRWDLLKLEFKHLKS